MQQPTQSGTNITDGPDSDPVSLGFSSLDSSDSSDDNYSSEEKPKETGSESGPSVTFVPDWVGCCMAKYFL